MNSIVALPIVSAIPVVAPAVAVDPIFAALDAHRRAFAELVADGGSSKELADRSRAAQKRLLRTRPTTPAGLAALTTWAREEANKMLGNSHWLDHDLCDLAATIDDAARGMSGLQPWSPPNAPLLRAEEMVSAIREGVDLELDEQAAEVMLEYFRSRDMWADESHMSDHELEDDLKRFYSQVLSFADRYNQSLDWVVRGDPSTMICSLAAQSAGAHEACVNEPDPIFAAIERHKLAVAQYNRLCDQQDDLEDKIPREKRQTGEHEDGQLVIVETDDPRWVAFQQGMDEVTDAEIQAECDLVNVVPTSIAGVIAVLEYGDEIEETIGFREVYRYPAAPDPKRGYSWHYCVSRNLAGYLRSIGA
jgi:hypothetical protein